jgi:hypothetical protein
MDSSDLNPKMRPDLGQLAGSGGALPATTEQKAFVTVPYPAGASCPPSRGCVVVSSLV